MTAEMGRAARERRPRTDRSGKSYSVYRVRAAGLNRTLPRGTTKKQAAAWETKVKQAAQVGQLDQLEAGKETLAEFAEEWGTQYAANNLQRNTLKSYASVLNLHYILPRIGDYRLRELRPDVIAKLSADLAADGVGAPTIRRALAILQGMLRRAVQWGRIRSNPVAVVDKPRVRRERAIRPLLPNEIEAIRSELGPRDRTIVSCLAYSGPCPSELLTLPLLWEDVGEQTLIYGQRKLNRAPRVDLAGPLHSDLAEWRMAAGRPESGPVFPAHDGEAWTDEHWRNWRRRVFMPAVKRAGVQLGRPYDLRHTWASLLIQDGRLSVVDIAAQMGHSTETLLKNFAHVIAELKGNQIPVEELIRAARRPQDVPTSDESTGG